MCVCDVFLTCGVGSQGWHRHSPMFTASWRPKRPFEGGCARIMDGKIEQCASLSYWQHTASKASFRGRGKANYRHEIGATYYYYVTYIKEIYMLHTAYIDVARIPGKLTFTTSWGWPLVRGRSLHVVPLFIILPGKNWNFPWVSMDFPAIDCWKMEHVQETTCFDHRVFLHIFHQDRTSIFPKPPVISSMACW